MHRFVAISEFKQELLSGNIQLESKSTIFWAVWPWNSTDDLEKPKAQLFHTASSFVHYFVAIGEFKLELESGNAQFGSNSTIFRAVWPWNWRMTLKNNKAPFLCCFKLCASFGNHWWIKTSYSPETPNLGQIRPFIFVPCDLEIWWMPLKNNMTSPLRCFKLCASFHSHRWIKT